MEEGYIKYQCFWEKKVISVPYHVLDGINKIRGQLIERNMIGKIPGGPGFGNISVRTSKNLFVISGTNTGHINELKSEQLSFVTSVNIPKNTVYCEGETQASSESMTHAAIYKKSSHVNAVIHIHHEGLWKKLFHKHPTTSPEIAYGTPEMAEAVMDKLKDIKKYQVLVLGGHQDGIISFGTSIGEAYDKIIRVLTEYK